jgi:hypothetical protein
VNSRSCFAFFNKLLGLGVGERYGMAILFDSFTPLRFQGFRVAFSVADVRANIGGPGDILLTLRR